MAWFFTEENISGNNYTLVGESAKHISKVLRMRTGEDITLVSPDKTQYECKISLITQGEVTVDIISQKPCENEPDVFVTLYQALPKGDKMDFIVQKCTELGISRIVPMISARCVSRPDEKSLKKKCERWQKIALQAAMQMAEGARKISGADLAVSTTGIAGPTGGTPEKPIGLVFCGISTKDKSYAIKLMLGGSINKTNSRSYIRKLTSDAVFLTILSILQ